MKNRDGLVNNDHWETPDYLYKALNDEFNFDFDPCPLMADFDGLSIEWGKSNFINPPYNRIDKPKFIQKAFEEWNKGKTCVLLVPSSTGTNQTHNIIFKVCKQRITFEEFINNEYNKSESVLIFIKGRISFKGYNTKGEYTTKNKGKHDSMIVIFKH